MRLFNLSCLFFIFFPLYPIGIFLVSPLSFMVLGFEGSILHLSKKDTTAFLFESIWSFLPTGQIPNQRIIEIHLKLATYKMVSPVVKFLTSNKKGQSVTI